MSKPTFQRRILLAEDEEAMRTYLTRALEKSGYAVDSVDCGTAALPLLESDDYALLLSDIVMPEMDGPTLLGELRKRRPDIKFIFVSGYAEDAFATNLPADAKFGFLPKPFSLKQLATIVKEMLEGEE